MVQYNCDANENPTTYRGKTLTWTRGRLLETCPSLTSPNVTWTFTYNADGIRVGKSAPGVTTTYGVDGERIVYEKTNGQVKRYFYDESGIAGFEYDGQKYIFRKNLQGDVTGIYDMSGTLVGEYEYDAWGNLLNEPESDVLLWGPFRYRGYYYDTSIGLYYLNSRYYDPETGRFLNEDLVSCLDPETIGGINPYAYCGNNPVMGYDPEGTWNWNAFGLIVAIFASAVVGVVLTVLPGGIVGAFFGGAAIGFATSATENLVSQVSTNGWENVDYGRAWKEGFVGTVVGAVGGLFSYGISNIAGFVGRNVGLAFSQAKHIGSGIQFGKVFGVNALTTLGAGIGNVVGSIGGATLGEYFVNKSFKRDYSFDRDFIETVKGELPGLMLSFLKWAL